MKRYLISSGVTFLAGFCMVLAAQIDSIELSSFKDGVLVGVVFAAVRAGVKAVAEFMVLALTEKE